MRPHLTPPEACVGLARTGIVLVAAALLCTASGAYARAAPEPPPAVGGVERLTAVACPDPTADGTQFGGALFERPKLSGDWLGGRSALRDRGLTLDVSTTQFYQGVTTGGLERAFPYGGRNDYFLNLDGEQFGLWKGFHVTLHGETRYGQSTNLLTGALSPTNLLLSVPQEDGAVTALTGVQFFQHLTDDFLVYAGKVNTLDAFRQPLTWAGGLDGFWNTALVFNPVYSRTVPYSTFATGCVYQRKDDPVPVFLFDVLDTNDTPTTSGFDTFFDNGVTLFAWLNVPTRFFGKPGHQGIAGTYSSGRYTNLGPSSYLDPVDELVFQSAPKRGSWCVAYNFDQAVWVAPDDPGRAWGVFGNLGIADDNPSPVRWFASAGVAGSSPLAGRGRDTFGVGYYYLGVSSALKANARAVTPLADEQGFEVYYNARVTPWFQLTPDLQVLDPFQKAARPALLVGLRARLDF